jgi:hypothetical protein
MLNAWSAVSTLDRMFDDVMGSAFGTATSKLVTRLGAQGCFR